MSSFSSTVICTPSIKWIQEDFHRSVVVTNNGQRSWSKRVVVSRLFSNSGHVSLRISIRIIEILALFAFTAILVCKFTILKGASLMPELWTGGRNEVIGTIILINTESANMVIQIITSIIRQIEVSLVIPLYTVRNNLHWCNSTLSSLELNSRAH